MFRLYNPTNPIVNTKLMNALNNGKKDNSDICMQNVLDELFNADFLLPVDTKRSEEGLYDVFMIGENDKTYIPIYTNYFEMMKMPDIQKNQKAFVMDMDEIIDLLYELYEFGYNIQGIIVNPCSNNWFFDNQLLDSMQIIMQQNRQKKVYEELHNILSTEHESIVKKDKENNK